MPVLHDYYSSVAEAAASVVAVVVVVIAALRMPCTCCDDLIRTVMIAII